MASDGRVTTTFGQLIADGVLEIGDGYRAKNEELGGDGPIFLRAGHVTDTHIEFAGVERFHASLADKVRSKMSRAGDAIVTTKGNSTGRTAFVTESIPQFVYSPHLSYWRSLDARKLKPGFLRFWSKSAEFTAQLAGMKASTDMAPYLSLVDQRRLAITLPSPGDQDAIAHILGALDDRIELNREMNKTLDEVARALFKSWFIDFDPVRAKADDRQLPLPSFLSDLFPKSLQRTEWGEIPTRWVVGSVGEYMLNFDSKRIPVSGAERAKRQGPYPYHGAAGVMDYIDDYLFDGIYLLVGEDGSVMRDDGRAVTQYAWGKFWVNNHAHVLEGKGSVSTEQLYLYFQFETVAPYVTGAVQPKLSQGRMNTMPFVFAGEKICNAFAEAVQPLFARHRVNVEANRTLAAIRDALLPKLMSGEVRIEEAHRLIGRHS